MMTNEQAVKLLKEKGCVAATAESLTGGRIAGCLVDVSGASEVFCGGFVTYTNEMKHKLLGVKKKTLRQHGAVSRKTVCEMAKGAVERTGADYGIAATGIAGPAPDEGKPVGLVYIACFDQKRKWMGVRELHLSGDRQEIRKKTTEKALSLLCQALSEA